MKPKTSTKLIIACGTKVIIGEEIEATVLKICLEGLEHCVTYQIGWWAGSSYKIEWFPENLIKYEEKKMTTLGFAANDGSEK